MKKTLYNFSLMKKSEIHTLRFAIASLNPQYIHTISILYLQYGNIPLLWIIKIHSISTLFFYGFSKFFPVFSYLTWFAKYFNQKQCSVRHLGIIIDLINLVFHDVTSWVNSLKRLHVGQAVSCFPILFTFIQHVLELKCFYGN